MCPGKVCRCSRSQRSANGLTRDLQGRLVACEHDRRRVTRQELDGSLTVIANSFQERRLNRPNDGGNPRAACTSLTRALFPRRPNLSAVSDLTASVPTSSAGQEKEETMTRATADMTEKAAHEA